MNVSTMSRRDLFARAGTLGAVVALGGCATATATGNTAQQASSPVTLQSDLSSPLASRR